MAAKYQEIHTAIGNVKDNMATHIAFLWDKYKGLRTLREQAWQELRDYLFATSTRTTTVQQWKNSTTSPKLTQLRDNLHANYISTLIPNDNWLRWIGETDLDQEKASMIEAYMRDKANQSRLRNTLSALIYDYIDKGICFGTAYSVDEKFKLPSGRIVTGYQGPVAHRINPFDIVFDPTASSFADAPKIIREVKSIPELEEYARTSENWAEAVDKIKTLRRSVSAFTKDDWHKAKAFSTDGFGDVKEYFASNAVELLIFKGNYYDSETFTTYENQEIIIADRCITAYTGPNESWLGKGDIVSAVWRPVPDNLYGMGPLDNLVGMQYRIDHLENLKADAMDLMIHPPIVVRGEVEPFVWQPEEQIRIIGDNGSIDELGKNFANVAAANNEISMLEAKMEEYAGAPKQAMGIRTPGEKTAFEVQSLENAAGRIFQEKVTNFEINVVEPLLNLMLALGRSKMESEISVRAINSEIGVEEFLTIQPEDLVAYGTVRPIGARHFGEQAQLLQNINQVFAGPLGQMIQPHWSAVNTAKLIEDSLNLSRFKLVQKEVGLNEQADMQDTSNHLQQIVAERDQAMRDQ